MAPEAVDILIRNGTILTVDGERRIVTDGAVAVRGERIVAVGRRPISMPPIRRKKPSMPLSSWSCPG